MAHCNNQLDIEYTAKQARLDLEACIVQPRFAGEGKFRHNSLREKKQEKQHEESLDAWLENVRSLIASQEA